MAGKLSIRSGTKLNIAFDVASGSEPQFNMICTFAKSLDDSAFLISIPMKNGKALELDDSQKLLIRYGSGDSAMIVAGYADDIVKDGIRRYWKIRRVAEQRQFFKRSDERVKIALRVEYYQDSWEVGDDGKIVPDSGMSLDISAGGAAVYMNRIFEVGEIVNFDLPRLGVNKEGEGINDIVAVVCWNREAPKGSLYRHVCGLQFRYAENSERQEVQDYVNFVKKKYKL